MHLRTRDYSACEQHNTSSKTNEAAIKQMKKIRSLTMRHVSSTHRVNLDGLFDRMIQILYVITTQPFADILTKASFARQMDTIDTIGEHHDLHQSNLSVSSAVVKLLFSSMSKRAGESFRTTASAKQKPVHCSEPIARTHSDKNADMDSHAVLPPEHGAGSDSKRENLCQQDSDKWKLQEHKTLADQLRQKICQVVRKFILSEYWWRPVHQEVRRSRK